MSEVVGRLAPSPTGRLHLGHARSFLIAWWSARSQGGRVVLRIEDLDASRVREGATELVLRDLEWLGLDWDGEPLVQSSRSEAHAEALSRLLSSGSAYPCVCTRKEIEAAASAPHAEDAETPYPGTCRERFLDRDAARRETGREPAVRLRVEPGIVPVHDEFQGAVEVDVHGAAGDFVIARKDGHAAYQLATPLDDAHQGVTEVVRGDDLLPSAARQALVLRALGLPQPKQLHVPLVQSADGRRLAKRAGSLSLEELRDAGVSPHQVAAWAARSIGLGAAPGGPEPSPASAFIAAFPRSNPATGPVILGPDPVGDL